MTWEPVVELARDAVTERSCKALHGLLDGQGPPPSDGEALPLLWHWMAFLPLVAQRDLGVDGHPKLGGFLPPLEGTRRMFAGARFKLHRAIHVGEVLDRRSVVTSVQKKSGRSGELTFVEVTHEISIAGHLALTEVQDIVYRNAETMSTDRLHGDGAEPAMAGLPSTGQGAPSDPGPAATPAEMKRASSEPAYSAPSDPGSSVSSGSDPKELVDKDWEWSSGLDVSPTMLFRFSALTYNAHRIHYDRDYATKVEGYPGLVVHGPLQAVALAELCRAHVPGRSLDSFTFRARRPAFDSGPLRLMGRLTASGQVELAAFDAQGSATMTATGELLGATR